MNIRDKLIRLGDKIAECDKCQLCSQRQNVVVGRGNVDAKLFIIGEAPGAEEDRTGRPFVGDSGRLLQNLMDRQGMARELAYITNMVKCRPPGNRNPEPAELEACSLFLRVQLRIIQPKAILALGAFAGNFVNDTRGVAVGKMRGQGIRYNRDGLDIPAVVTYHPSYVLRKQSKAVHTIVKEDFIKAVKLAFGRAMVKVPKGAKVMKYVRTIDTGAERYHVMSCRCERGSSPWHEKESTGTAQCPTCEKTVPLTAVLPENWR